MIYNGVDCGDEISVSDLVNLLNRKGASANRMANYFGREFGCAQLLRAAPALSAPGPVPFG